MGSACFLALSRYFSASRSSLVPWYLVRGRVGVRVTVRVRVRVRVRVMVPVADGLVAAAALRVLEQVAQLLVRVRAGFGFG